MNIQQNIRKGRKSNKAAKYTAIITVAALLLSVFVPENEASKYILANIEIIVSSAISVIIVSSALIRR
jgi:hypothetical protein